MITIPGMLPVKRKHLSAEQKKEICKKKRRFPSILNNELAKEYGVQKTCISDILKQSPKWLNIDTTNKAKASRKRERQPKWPKLDEAMQVWVESALAANMDLTQAALLTKAKVFATALNIANFKEALNQHRENLQKFCEGYTLDNIWNADETALYWKMRPSKTLAKGPVSGHKKEKARVSLMFATNATGTEKLPPVFIHTSENPHPLRNINKKRLPVWYYWNKTAWMQVSTYNNWLEHVDEIMERQNRYILLLVDYCTTHIQQQVELKLKEEYNSLGDLINNMVITDEVNDPMDVKEYVEIDAEVIFEMPSDNDIIRAIEDRDSNSQQEEIELLPKISDYDALKAFNLIETYLL
ncbi:42929_t:CDS:2 [Gigaspora margarita]|uniref:42929_t:CDS:1 n=1 Tax=Gigaspora margarita TaxID=4874 RepID=A0ABN7WR56_GIGMA|nr:42929_t:CDS:2 [Gigaspora margarita]